MTEGKVWEASAVPAPATTQLHLSPSRFCLRLEKDTVETQGMCLLLTLISAAPLSLISQC